MASKTNKSKNLVDLMVENQTKIADQFVDATKKLTNDVPFVKETLDKGNKIYKDMLNSTSDLAEKATENFKETNQKMKKSNESVGNFFQEWFENQMNWATNAFKANSKNNGFDANPTEWLQTWQNQWNQMNNQWNQNMNMAPWFQMMNNNPFMNMNTMKSSVNDQMGMWANYYKQYADMMNNSFGDWWKHFPNSTTADSFLGMNKMAESLSKFYELWMPMFKSIKNNSFDLNVYREYMNADKYKAFVDSFFSLMPDDAKKQYEEVNKNFVQYMKQMSEMGLNNYHQMKGFMSNNPLMASNPFNQMVEMYSGWKNSMTEAVSPLSKLFANNASVKNAQQWNAIYDRMLELNAKNNELQYMVYKTSIKVMDKLAEQTAAKVSKGESIDSIVKMYQDWMMLGDEQFTSMFESNEYSKLMTEVSSLQMKLKQDMDAQMEKMFFTHMPLATRSEMDEVYKNLYDLKKTCRNLERMMNPETKKEKKSSKKK